MTIDIIVTVVAGILMAVAVFGTIYPLLPGSPVALVTLIAWGWVLGSAASWTAAGIGALFVCVGWSASAVLTGRKLKKQSIPKGSILIAALAGIVGMFVIPVFGLFLGFAGGLFLSEYVRLERLPRRGKIQHRDPESDGHGHADRILDGVSCSIGVDDRGDRPLHGGVSGAPA